VSGKEQSGTPVPMIEPLAVRIPEACRIIGIGRPKLYELIADGTIEVAKIGTSLGGMLGNAGGIRPGLAALDWQYRATAPGRSGRRMRQPSLGRTTRNEVGT